MSQIGGVFYNYKLCIHFFCIDKRSKEIAGAM